LIALTYITGPTSTMSLSHHLPELHRPFRLSGAYLLSVLCMFASYFSVFMECMGYSIKRRYSFDYCLSNARYI
ncbi:APC family permease, partial [Francisella tularensis subsp. holarctica]|nr:APC family permease [Francisella tularensis subsp. holarctica]